MVRQAVKCVNRRGGGSRKNIQASGHLPRMLLLVLIN